LANLRAEEQKRLSGFLAAFLVDDLNYGDDVRHAQLFVQPTTNVAGLACTLSSRATQADRDSLHARRTRRILAIMTKQQSEALSVLAPGVFIRAGVQCPHCRRRMDAQADWSVRDSLMHWSYVCQRCGTVLDMNMKVVSSLAVWKLPGTEKPLKKGYNREATPTPR
jgi:hypothetical protein